MRRVRRPFHGQTSVEGPYHDLWNLPRKLEWRDGEAVDRLLRWPEVFKAVDALPAGTERVYVRFKKLRTSF